MLHRQGRQRQIGGAALAGPVLAVVAIVISLGGVAFATNMLPKGSVGKAQLKGGAVVSSKIHWRAVGQRHLKPGAVTTSNLNFPIGATGIVNTQDEQIVGTGHCGPWEGPGEPPPCKPDVNVNLASKTIELASPAFVDVSAITHLYSKGVYGHTDGTASVRLLVGIDGEPLSPYFELKLGFGQTRAIPLQGFAELGPGRHTIDVMAGGHGYDYLDVDATSTVMTARVSPKL